MDQEFAAIKIDLNNINKDIKYLNEQISDIKTILITINKQLTDNHTESIKRIDETFEMAECACNEASNACSTAESRCCQ